MASWSDFAAAEPQLAAAVRALLQQYGPGLGYLATVRPDGGPRLHPVAPVFTDEGLYCFVVNSPKRRDLERDGRYALHSYPPEDSDDEAYLSGHASPVTDASVIAALADSLHASSDVDWRIFELTIDTAMLRHHGPARGRPTSRPPHPPPLPPPPRPRRRSPPARDVPPPHPHPPDMARPRPRVSQRRLRSTRAVRTAARGRGHRPGAPAASEG